jgi:Fe-S cluster assembly iron-binding protein IscA
MGRPLCRPFFQSLCDVDRFFSETYEHGMGSTTSNLLTVTDAAKMALARCFAETTRPPLRVFLSFLNDAGPRLELAPDTPTATDTSFTVDGWHCVINTQLLQQAAPVMIDFGPDGFVIHSSLDFSEAGGNCGGACGSH